jgi:hypothetical protein
MNVELPRLISSLTTDLAETMAGHDNYNPTWQPSSEPLAADDVHLWGDHGVSHLRPIESSNISALSTLGGGFFTPNNLVFLY